MHEASVRIAIRADEPALLRLLDMMWQESGLLSLDVGAAREMFDTAFNRRGGIIGVIGPSHDIEAAIGLSISRFWYTRENHIDEYFNFVRPDRRRSDHAQTLITFAKKCSDEIGIPLCIGVLTNRRLEAKVRLYQRLLGFPAGAFFVHGATWINERPNNESFWTKPFPRRGNGIGSRVCGTTQPAL